MTVVMNKAPNALNMIFDSLRERKAQRQGERLQEQAIHKAACIVIDSVVTRGVFYKLASTTLAAIVLLVIVSNAFTIFLESQFGQCMVPLKAVKTQRNHHETIKPETSIYIIIYLLNPLIGIEPNCKSK